MVDLQAAYAACARAAAAHYENFPVASLLMPASMRQHVAAVYAFARSADDFADEGQRSQDERLRLLELWRRRLHGHHGAPEAGEPPHAEAVFHALGATVRDLSLPIDLFDDLLSAFRQDVTVTRYDTWQDVFDYCRRSANPVGRLVLRIAGYRDAARDEQSDAICTALQLANFWQDLGRDFSRGRVYVPQAVLRAEGAVEGDLAHAPLSEPWRRVVAACVSRTRELFARGRPLCSSLGGRLRYELRATWLGGMRILERIEASGFDPVAERPVIGPSDLPRLAWRMAVWSDR